MKKGILKKGFQFNSLANMTFRIPGGIRVIADGDTVYFILAEDAPLRSQPVRAWRKEGKFYASIYDTVHQLQPFKPREPFPLTLI